MAQRVTTAEMPTKKSGDQFFATEAERIRAALNANASELEGLAFPGIPATDTRPAFPTALAALGYLLGQPGLSELVLPQQVAQDSLYVTTTGIWAARRSMAATADPTPGPNWRLVAGFAGQQPTLGSANITDATEAGRRLLTAPDAAAQRALLSNPGIVAGQWGNHPGWSNTDGGTGLYEWLVKGVLKALAFQQPAVGQPAPTVTGYLPSTGAVGAPVTVTGTDFTKATAVLFNGTPASFQVVNATTILAVVPVGATSGPVTVSTATGTGTSTASFTVIATAPVGDTAAPTINFTVPAAGATLTVGAQVVLTVTATDNVAVQGVAFTNGATGAALGAGAKNGNTYTLPYTPTAAGPLSLVATATDAAGNSQSATVNVTVQATANMLPTASAGQDLTVTKPTNQAALSGNGTDNDGTIVGYAWEQVSGPNSVTGLPASTKDVTISNFIVGVYEFKVTVTDDRGGTGSDLVKLTVNPEAATALAPATADYWYNGNIVRPNGSGQKLHAAFSQLRVAFTGTALNMSAFATGGSGSVYVKDSGSFSQLFSPSPAGQLYQLNNLTSPVFITSGGQQRSYEQGDVQGADVLSVAFPNGATGYFIQPTQTKRAIAIPGDSISNGALLANAQTQAWSTMLRKDGVSTTVMGYGSGTGAVMLDPQYWNSPNPISGLSLKAELHAILDGADEQVVATSIGTNDYGGSGAGALSPADFQARFRTFLQNVKAEFPSAKVLILTPFFRTDEAGANSFGATLQAYRDAEAAAAAGLTNVTVRNGLGILIASDLVDGVHPNAGGHLKILNFVQPEIDNLFVVGSTAPDLVDMAGLASQDWIQLVKATSTNGTFTKNGNTTQRWDSGGVWPFRAGTTAGAGIKAQVNIPGNQIAHDGDVNNGAVVGMSTSPPDYTATSNGEPTNFFSISACFYWDGAKYGLIEAGQAYPFITYPWQAGVFPDFDQTLEQDAAGNLSVKYYVGKRLIYTSAYNPAGHMPLYVCVAVAKPGASVKGVRVAGLNLVATTAPPTYVPAGRYHDEDFQSGLAGTRLIGSWPHYTNSDGDAGGISTGTDGSVAELDFNGTSVTLQGNMYQDLGAYELYLKGPNDSAFQLRYQGTQYVPGYPNPPGSLSLYTISGLPIGNYTVRLVAKAYITFDGFVVA